MECGPTSRCRCSRIRDRLIIRDGGVVRTITRGNAPSTITSPASTSSATFRRRGRCVCRIWNHRPDMPLTDQPRRVLMTADAVGGVWTYALELCQELESRHIAVMLAT